MSRKAIDKQQPTECRQAIWEWIRSYTNPSTHNCFTINDIARDINLDVASIREYLAGLSNAGYLASQKAETTSRLPVIVYQLTNDIGVDAPRVRKDGSHVTQGQGRQQIWNAMRILKTFSAVDLAFNASIPECQIAEAEAKNYCQALCKAGYLRQLSPGKPGHKPGTGTVARYMLIPAMWSGPHPPQIQRTKQIYDPNLKRVVWARVEGGAE